MICPYCHAEVSDSMKFCENCGSALPLNAAQQDKEQSPTPADGPWNTPDTLQRESLQPASQMRTTDPHANTQKLGQQPTSTYGGVEQFGQQQVSNYGAEQPANSYGTEQQFGQQSGGYNDAQRFNQQFGQQQTGGFDFGQQASGQPFTPPTTPAGYAPTNFGPQASSTPFVLAIIALVTSVFGLFPVSIILGIVALVMNSKQKKRGEFSTKQTPTTVMSIISLVLSAIMLVVTIMVSGLVAAYIASEGLGSRSSGTSISLSTPRSSSSAAGAAEANGASQSDDNSSKPSAEITDKLAGTWKLTGLVSGGVSVDLKEIELMQDMGIVVELMLNADGTAAFTFYGATMQGSWESPDGSVLTLTLNGGRIDATVTGDVLTFAYDSDEMSFTKQ